MARRPVSPAMEKITRPENARLPSRTTAVAVHGWFAVPATAPSCSRAVIRPSVAADTVEASASAASAATATRNIVVPTPAPSLRFRRYQSGSPFVPQAARVR